VAAGSGAGDEEQAALALEVLGEDDLLPFLSRNAALNACPPSAAASAHRWRQPLEEINSRLQEEISVCAWVPFSPAMIRKHRESMPTWPLS
jgi:hypothetical protein